MANEVLVGLKIGAAVSGTLHAAFGSARSTVQQLGRATDGLTAKQNQIGTALAASVARGGAGVGRLRHQYDQVGRTLDQLKAKQERLNLSIARGETLKAQRADLRGQAMETAGTAAAIGAPLVMAARTAIDFKDRTNDIAITGGFDAAEEERLGNVLRGAALQWNQTQMDLAAGAQVLIAGGISSVRELEAYAPVMAKAATATRASMDDLGAVAIALNDNLGIGAAGLERSMNMLAHAGKSGQFELADMAKWLPQLTPQFAALGITGEKAVAEIGASLQIARRGAGSNDEAANNFKNFLSKLTAKDTLKSFESAGIDLQESMQNLVGDGLTPVQAMLEVITQYVGSKAPEAAGEFQQAMALKDDAERQAALDRLNEAYKLGELFADQQVLSFIRPALANRQDLADIQRGSVAAADQGVLDADWKKRMENPKEQLKALTINLSELGITIGGMLLPALVDVTQAALPVIQGFATWAGENPLLVKSVIGLVGGLLAGKLAFIGLAYGANLVMSPFVAMTTTITGLSAKWTLLRGMFQAGRFMPFISGLKLAGQAVLWLGRALLMTPIGWIGMAIAGTGLLIYKFWEPLKAFFGGFFEGVKAGLTPLGAAFASAFESIAPALSRIGALVAPVIQWFSKLFTPVEMAGTALQGTSAAGLTFGRALGSALGLLLTPLRWVLEFVGEIPTAFSNGLGGVAELILNFSPLGLFYRAFAGVMNYFGIELPGRFSEFGGMLVSGLVSGITNMAGAAMDAVHGIGDSIKGWFTETLGIHSPSRVFMGYGANLSEGAAIGITEQSGLVRQAALGLAAATAVSLAPPSLAMPEAASLARPAPDPSAVSMASAAPQSQAGAAGAMQITFAPVITLPGGGEAPTHLSQALQASYAEFVRMMERYEHERRRRSYGAVPGGNG